MFERRRAERLRGSIDPNELRNQSDNKSDEVRAAVAGNPHTPEDVLWALTRDESAIVSEALARNPTLSERCFLILCDRATGSFLARRVIAARADCPEVAFEVLASQDRAATETVMWVRHQAVTRVLAAAEQGTQDQVVERMARGIESTIQDYRISEVVARNPSAPPRILQLLASDPSDAVRKGVAHNPATPAEALEQVANFLPMGQAMERAENPATPPEVLDLLTRHEVWLVSAKVAANPSTSVETLRRLSSRGRPSIRGAAEANLAARRGAT